MKTKIYLIVAGLLLTASVFAQAPQKMTYQAVVRNSSNALVKSSPVGMKVSLLQGSVTGTAVYIETHTTQTNQNGLLDIEIGGGTIVSGTYLNGIYWAGGPYFIKTEIDPLGGNNYTITSTSELLSVPYSNYSNVSGVLAGYASSFQGAYKNSGAIGTNPAYSTFIHYLDLNKVSLKIYFATNDGNGGSKDVTLFATVTETTITILANENVKIYGSGTKNGNSLIFNLTFPGEPGYSNPVTYNFDVVKM